MSTSRWALFVAGALIILSAAGITYLSTERPGAMRLTTMPLDRAMKTLSAPQSPQLSGEPRLANPDRLGSARFEESPQLAGGFVNAGMSTTDAAFGPPTHGASHSLPMQVPPSQARRQAALSKAAATADRRRPRGELQGGREQRSEITSCCAPLYRREDILITSSMMAGTTGRINAKTDDGRL